VNKVASLTIWTPTPPLSSIFSSTVSVSHSVHLVNFSMLFIASFRLCPVSLGLFSTFYYYSSEPQESQPSYLASLSNSQLPLGIRGLASGIRFSSPSFHNAVMSLKGVQFL
jgi:hypothetical protein